MPSGARRPKPAKLAINEELRRYVQERLAGVVRRPDGTAVGGPRVPWKGRRHGWRAGWRWAVAWSPEQISPIYFCDPRSPWQRATNENTNGLLRQYFPKGTDLTRHSASDLAAVAAALNSCPRKILGWRTPAEVLDEHLAAAA